MNEKIEMLRSVVIATHGFEARHVGNVPVRIAQEGMELFNGDVEVFQLKGHPCCEWAYAWEMNHRGNLRPFAAIQYPPVDDAATAVGAAIALGFG